MALNKWLKDTQIGLQTNPTRLYWFVYGGVGFLLFVFVGFGFMILWQGLPHVLLAIAPFSQNVSKLLGHLGLPAQTIEKLRTSRRSNVWVFSGSQLIVAGIFLAAGIFLISKANFSLISLLFMASRR